MDAKALKSITAHVYRKFPEVQGASPKVRLQQGAGGSTTSTYLLTFQARVQSSNGKSIPRLVRVVATDSGRILKMTTSRG